MTKPESLKRRATLLLPCKVSQIVESLTTSWFADAEPEPQQGAEIVFVADEVVTRAIEEWLQRAFYLPRQLLSDPAWGILLELLQAELQGRRASLSSIRKMSAAPGSTADRWLKALECHGYVNRRADPLHLDEEIICLSRKGSSAMRSYFHEVVQSRESLEREC